MENVNIVAIDCNESIAIKRAMYNPESQNLFISFHKPQKNKNRTYRYSGVPDFLVDRFQKAGSKGTFFRENIRNQFAWEKV